MSHHYDNVVDLPALRISLYNPYRKKADPPVKFLSLASVMVLGSASLLADTTPAAIAAAIADGVQHKTRRHHGLVLAPFSKGAFIEVYTPLTWITQRAAAAAREYRPFTVADAEPLLEPVLRVVANPVTPEKLQDGGSSVQHVVLQDERKTTTIQPLTSEPFSIDLQNAMGAKVSYDGLTVTFPLDALRQSRTTGKGDLVVVVVYTAGYEQRFTIKPKHFEKLPLE